MRVIAGTAKGRRLTGFTGVAIRPTPDRVREALFSILESRLGSFVGRQALDLFAGSGALAIEALSRGAERACLVEQATAAYKTIRENLERCGFGDRTVLFNRDAFALLPGLQKHGPFDIIFLDPPYGKGQAERALREIQRLRLLSPDGVICIETGDRETLPDHLDDLERDDQRRYGSIMLHFYQFAEQAQP